MSYAVIALGGKQYIVSEGTKLVIDSVKQEEGASFECEQVLLSNDGKASEFGTPFLPKKKVTLKVLKNLKGDKIRVATYKAKSRTRNVRGHRQHLSKVEVVKLS